MYSDFSSINRAALSSDDRHRKIADIQRETMMVEADLKKFQAEKAMLEAEERKAKKTIEILRMDMQKTQKKIQVCDQNINIKHAEIMHLKKQLNLL